MEMKKPARKVSVLYHTKYPRIHESNGNANFFSSAFEEFLKGLYFLQCFFLINPELKEKPGI